MRPYAAIALCGAVALVQQAEPLQAQIYKGGEKAKVGLDPVRVEEMLNSTPGCQRHRVSSSDIAAELNRVVANARCKNYVAFVPACAKGLVWDYRQTRHLTTGWPRGTAPLTIARQNEIIREARTEAAAIPAPAGTRLYRLTFTWQMVGSGPLIKPVINGAAHYAVCARGHS